MSKIGIIGAMDEEVTLLKKSMHGVKATVKAGMIFAERTLWGKETVVVVSGIGKVNMAVCAQMLIDLFKVDTLINTGVAGSLDAKIDIGDIVAEQPISHIQVGNVVMLTCKGSGY
jgi:adenosylhomocysteine nucleosidase